MYPVPDDVPVEDMDGSDSVGDHGNKKPCKCHLHSDLPGFIFICIRSASSTDEGRVDDEMAVDFNGMDADFSF